MRISSLAIIRDSNSLVLGQVFFFVLVSKVLARLKDNKGQNSLSLGINTLDNCYLLAVA